MAVFIAKPTLPRRTADRSCWLTSPMRSSSLASTSWVRQMSSSSSLMRMLPRLKPQKPSFLRSGVVYAALPVAPAQRRRARQGSAAQAIEAILTVFPLDSFVDAPAERMEVGANPKDIPPVQAEVQKVIDKAEGKSWPMGSIERFAFYEKARTAYAVIVTGETRFYGCFILKKGVIPPSA